MEIKKTVDLESLTQAEKEALENGTVTEEEKIKKAEELANNYKIRAEKAEGKLKEEKKEVIAPKKDDSLSQSDLIAIIKADVAEEDIEEVTVYAKIKNISVADALKTNIIKTVLADKKEERTTAAATNTGNARKGSSRPNPSQLLEQAQKTGELPESEEDLTALVRERKGLK